VSVNVHITCDRVGHCDPFLSALRLANGWPAGVHVHLIPALDAKVEILVYVSSGR